MLYLTTIKHNEHFIIIIQQRGNTALMAAACYGNTDVITTLLDSGANVNAINMVSFSVLGLECMWVFGIYVV